MVGGQADNSGSYALGMEHVMFGNKYPCQFQDAPGSDSSYFHRSHRRNFERFHAVSVWIIQAPSKAPRTSDKQ